MTQDDKKTSVQHPEEKKHQYHPQFANSLHLELRENKNDLKALNDNVTHDTIKKLVLENDKLEETDQDYASKIIDFVWQINNYNLKEEDKMSVITDLLDARKQIKIRDEQLQSKDAEIASTKKELETQKEEVSNLKKRIEQLEKKLNSVAML